MKGLLKLKKKKKTNDLFFTHYFNKYQNPSGMYKKLHETKGKKNEHQVYSIKEILDKTKEYNKSAKEHVIQGNKKIILLNVFFTLINQNNKKEKD